MNPVFLKDKQREGNVKSFLELSEEELKHYHEINALPLKKILKKYDLDILHANHLIYQPIAAINACKLTKTPFAIYPHGSCIEYIIKLDERYRELALKGIMESSGLIIGNNEVRDRIFKLFPQYAQEILDKSTLVGVGVDTSLFQPVEKKKRIESINKLISMDFQTGKKPAQTTQLYDRLHKEGIQVVQDYGDKYDHSLPFSDIKNQLQQIPWDKNIIIFVGALTYGKGLQSLITAMPKIITLCPDTHLLIIGTGSYCEFLQAFTYAISTGNKKLLLNLTKHGLDLERNEEKGELTDVSCYLNNSSNLSFLLNNGSTLKNKIHFLGRLNHSQLRYVFPCADLAVFPSVIPEAYPLVLMESLANGVLPAVSYFSGFKDGIDELQNSIPESLLDKMKLPVNPETRISTMADNIVSLLNDPLLRSVSPELRYIAVENYDWKTRVVQMHHAYMNMINNTIVMPQK